MSSQIISVGCLGAEATMGDLVEHSGQQDGLGISCTEMAGLEARTPSDFGLIGSVSETADGCLRNGSLESAMELFSDELQHESDGSAEKLVTGDRAVAGNKDFR
jgi:hypothetical protein